MPGGSHDAEHNAARMTGVRYNLEKEKSGEKKEDGSAVEASREKTTEDEGIGGKKNPQKSSRGHKKNIHAHDAAETKVIKFWEQRYLVVDKGKHCVTEFSVTPPDFVWNASKVLKNSSARDFAQPNLGNLGLPGTARRRREAR